MKSGQRGLREAAPSNIKRPQASLHIPWPQPGPTHPCSLAAIWWTVRTTGQERAGEGLGAPGSAGNPPSTGSPEGHTSLLVWNPQMALPRARSSRYNAELAASPEPALHQFIPLTRSHVLPAPMPPLAPHQVHILKVLTLKSPLPGIPLRSNG